MSRSSPNSHAFSHPRDRVIVGRRARGSSLVRSRMGGAGRVAARPWAAAILC